MSRPAPTIAPTPSAIERFWPKFHKAPSGCWEWLAGRNAGGYGMFWNGQRQVVAHRFAYEAWREPIPEGLYLDHLCRNRGCVNPHHLEAVTHRVNTLRGIGPTAIHPKWTHCKVGHEFTDDNIIELKDGRRRCRICKRARDLQRWHEGGHSAIRATKRAQQTAVRHSTHN